jgi:hypothetical protein
MILMKLGKGLCKNMRELKTYTGQHFLFHIVKEDGDISITLSSEYVYPTMDKFELKELADFIYNFIDNDKNQSN